MVPLLPPFASASSLKRFNIIEIKKTFKSIIVRGYFGLGSYQVSFVCKMQVAQDRKGNVYFKDIIRVTGNKL
jgi:hypothetical protein